MVDAASRNNLIAQWHYAKNNLETAKAAELELRNKILDESFVWKEGTENLELGNGYKLKAVFKLNYRLFNKDNDVDKALTKLENAGTEGAFIAERLVKWKPELSVSEYKKLDEKFKQIIDEVLITYSSQPSLELVEPDAKDYAK